MLSRECCMLCSTTFIPLLIDSSIDERPPFPPSPGIMPPNVLRTLPDPRSTTQLLTRLPAFPSHTVVTMPALSPTMTAGNIGTWQKNPGDSLSPGDVLVEIETDKAQMDFEFQEEGVLAKVLKDSGAKDVAVGNVSATITTGRCED